MIHEWQRKDVAVAVAAAKEDIKKLKEELKRKTDWYNRVAFCEHLKIEDGGSFIYHIDRCTRCGYEWYI